MRAPALHKREAGVFLAVAAALALALLFLASHDITGTGYIPFISSTPSTPGSADQGVEVKGFTQSQARVGEPVTWYRLTDSADIGDADIPSNAVNVSRRPSQDYGGGPLPFSPAGNAYLITFQTEAPRITDVSESPSEKVVRITSETHYSNVIARTALPTPAPKEGISLRWVEEDATVPSRNITYMDEDSDGLVESIEWVVPHLSSQTYEINLTILNPITYLKDGDVWNVRFTTLGTGNLTIWSQNALFEEIMTDDPSTQDEMRFLDIRCGDESLSGSLDVMDASGTLYRYADIPADAGVKPEYFLIEDYSCDGGTGTFSTLINTAGYAELTFRFSNQEFPIFDLHMNGFSTIQTGAINPDRLNRLQLVHQLDERLQPHVGQPHAQLHFGKRRGAHHQHN